MRTKKRIAAGTINKYGYQKQTDGSYKYVGKGGVKRVVAPVGFVNKNGYQKQADGSYKYLGKQAFAEHEDKPAYKRALKMMQDLPTNTKLVPLRAPLLIEFKDRQGRKKEGFAIGHVREDGELVSKVVGVRGEWDVSFSQQRSQFYQL